MFERFTPPARQAIVLAQEEARVLGHRAIGSEHLLLGLLRAPGAANKALVSVGLGEDSARQDIVKMVGQGKQSTHGQVPFNPRTQRVLDLAMREAMSLGQEEVATEHILLALLAEKDGATAEILSAAAGPGAVREAVLTAMEEPPPDTPDPGPEASDVPAALSVRLGDDVRSLLRRAAGHALAADAPEVGVDHVRRALDT